MQSRHFSLVIAAALAIPSAELAAQQGSGRSGAGATANPGQGIGRGGSVPGRDIGAVRSVGRAQGSATVGAQLGVNNGVSGSKSQGAANGHLKAGGKAGAESNAMTLRARGRNEMSIRAAREPRESTTDSDRTKPGRPEHAAAVPAGTGAPWERSGMTRADWLLTKRLASIDHMRDIAVKNGNERQLQQADQLETVARQQHERRVGEFAEPTADVEAGGSVESSPGVSQVE
jgi:hypothetical protein